MLSGDRGSSAEECKDFPRHLRFGTQRACGLGPLGARSRSAYRFMLAMSTGERYPCTTTMPLSVT
jgi:hypothetical protein